MSSNQAKSGAPCGINGTLICSQEIIYKWWMIACFATAGSEMSCQMISCRKCVHNQSILENHCEMVSLWLSGCFFVPAVQKKNKQKQQPIKVHGQTWIPQPTKRLVNVSGNGFFWCFFCYTPSFMAKLPSSDERHNTDTPYSSNTRWYFMPHGNPFPEIVEISGVMIPTIAASILSDISTLGSH